MLRMNGYHGSDRCACDGWFRKLRKRGIGCILGFPGFLRFSFFIVVLCFGPHASNTREAAESPGPKSTATSGARKDRLDGGLLAPERSDDKERRMRADEQIAADLIIQCHASDPQHPFIRSIRVSLVVATRTGEPVPLPGRPRIPPFDTRQSRCSGFENVMFSHDRARIGSFRDAGFV